MRRREALTLLVGAGASWPLTVRAQQQTMPVIGYLSGSSPGSTTRGTAAFQQGLKEEGFAEGLNVATEYRWANGQYDQIPSMASELVRKRVALLAAIAPVSALAAKAATSTIPIVFLSGADPVKLGLVASLNRPGGNITGVSFFINSLVAKQFELLHDSHHERAPSPCSLIQIIPKLKARLETPKLQPLLSERNSWSSEPAPNSKSIKRLQFLPRIAQTQFKLPRTRTC